MIKSALFSWEVCLIKAIILAMVAFAMDRPVGSIEGRVSLEKPGFGLASFDLREQRVYVLAVGRGDGDWQRGVWVKEDGRFRLDQLPVGEYQLVTRAAGFNTSYENGIFVEEGRITRLKATIALSEEDPSVNIASNCRVFTTQERPHFWINAYGASSCSISIYRKSLPQLMAETERLAAARRAREQAGEGGEGGQDAGEAGEQDDAASSKGPPFYFGTELNVYKASDNLEDLFAGLKPVETFDRKLTMDMEDWAHAEFKTGAPLPPGDYFAIVAVAGPTGKKAKNLSWFSVSDLGLIVKQAPDRTLVRAIDLRTLRGRPGTTVSFSVRDFKKIGTVKTGADGFAEFKTPGGLPDRSNYQLVCLAENGADHAYSGLSFYQSDYDRFKTYFYTERPIYRLGQTVYYRGIARALEADGLKTPKAGTAVGIKIEDPDNQSLWQGEVKTSAHGTFNGVFRIPESGKTGAYQVTLTYPNGTTSYERFEVAQYRKPEYQVDVTPLTPRVVAGSRVRARVRARYFFGAPVAGARIKYSVYAAPDWSSRFRLQPRPQYYSYFDDWDSDDGGYSSGGGTYVTDGFAQTDETGEAVIEFGTESIKAPASGPYDSEQMDKTYRIEAEVTDLSRMSVIASAACQVTCGDFALFAEPQSWVVRPGEKIEATVTAIDYDGQPVANQEVTLSLKRFVWDRNRAEYKGEETAGEATVKTDADGHAVASFATAGTLPTDTYYVVAEASDKSGHLVHDSQSLWIASDNYPYTVSATAARQEPLSLKLDRPVYRPGDTARVMLSAPLTGQEGAQALVCVEGTGVHEFRLVEMKATAQLVEIPLKAAYAPNVYVSVCFVGANHQFYQLEKLVKVSPENHFLNLTINTDREKYKPGEAVRYEIEARNADGKPAAGVELSLGVVDESIYSIRAETAANIQKFFYGQRPNWVVTTCSFPEQYSGGPDKTEPRLRKDFRDTAAWLPSLTTDRNGRVTATVTLPDNLTTWRATVRGITTGSDVGWAVDKIIATQDLILRLALPRFFSQGDEGTISAIVHNYTDRAQPVELALSASPQFKIAGGLNQSLTVEPDKARRFDWKAVVVGPGEGVIRATARGQGTGDALERRLPIRPLGIPEFSVKSGLISQEEGSVALPFGMSADAAPGSERSRLTLAASSIGPVLGNFGALIDYPYGCTEQTMSRLMPSVVAVRLNQSLGVPLSREDRQRFQKVYSTAMAKLEDYHHADGGWGWWKNDQSNPYLTALVMEGLWRLKESGYAVSDSMTQAGIKWLQDASARLHKQLADPQLASGYWQRREAEVDLAKMLYCLSLWRHAAPETQSAYLSSRLNSLSPQALSYFCLAMARSGRSAAAPARRLAALANEGGGLANWDFSRELWLKFKDPEARESDFVYSYRFTGVETTALCLRALIAADPGNRPTIESAKQWLLLSRGKDGWDNTKTTAQVFLALLEEELAWRQGGQGTFRASVSLASEAILDMLFDDAARYGPEKSIELTSTARAGELTIRKSGPGRLYYSTLSTYFRRMAPGDQVSAKGSPAGLNISRQFFRLTPTAVDSEGKVRLRMSPLGADTVRAGETILMKVTIDSPVALPYIILDAALPSGAEVIDDSPAEENVEGEGGGSPYSGDWAPYWCTHKDVLDDRVVYFVTNLAAGKSEVHTLMRVEMPGSFQINPVSLEGMYSQKVRAYSALGAMRVAE